MPKISKATATKGGDHGAVEDRAGELLARVARLDERVLGPRRIATLGRGPSSSAR